jgi:hypothetical protein
MCRRLAFALGPQHRGPRHDTLAQQAELHRESTCPASPPSSQKALPRAPGRSATGTPSRSDIARPDTRSTSAHADTVKSGKGKRSPSAFVGVDRQRIVHDDSAPTELETADGNWGAVARRLSSRGWGHLAAARGRRSRRLHRSSIGTSRHLFGSRATGRTTGEHGAWSSLGGWHARRWVRSCRCRSRR